MSIGRVPGATGIQPSIVDAKGDLIVATAADSVDRLAVGTNEQRLVADSAAATGLKYVADTTNYAIAAKGDLLVGTAADTLAALSVGTNGHTLVADSSTSTGLKWAAPAGGGANWTLLNTGGTSLTGAATITVSGISNREQILMLIVGASSANAGAKIAIRINGDTGSNYTNMGNRIIGLSTYSASVVSTHDDNPGTYQLIAALANNASSVAYGGAHITGGLNTGIKSILTQGGASTGGGTAQSNYVLSGIYSGSAAITSVSLFSDSGNFDAGTLFVYGA